MKFHFMGIGGVGMAGVAFLLKKAGHEVSGCDARPSPRTRWLEACGIPVAVGHHPEHLADDVDRLVVPPAVPASEPELAAARAKSSAPGSRLAVRVRGEVLAQMVNASPRGVAVCGTHGKTTTATFTARLLLALGADPSWCIGGETGDLHVASTGAGPFVVEADESDGTLALYRAKILVITSLEYDHPDHFPSYADYLACYRRAADQAETVLCAADSGDGAPWGENPLADCPPEAWPEIPHLVLGAHNVRNALCAVAVCLRLGYSESAIRAALPRALDALPDRRFQPVWPPPKDAPATAAGNTPAIRVITDYAHHPGEIACALDMARATSPKRLRVLFQPHRYSRTRAFLDGFVQSLRSVDELVLLPVYAAFEPPVPGGTSADLYAAFRAGAPQPAALHLARSALEAWRHVFLTRRDDDLVLLLGAGDLIQLVPRIQADLSGVPPPTDERRTVFIGAGSNTWRSDLATDETFVRTLHPAGVPGASLGIPWMVGIPGTIGGWIKMNAGAFGHSISEVLRRVKVEGVWRTAAECGFGYRTSAIEGEIQDAEFDDDAIARARTEGPSAAEYLSRRRKFPAGTKGSVFKNPPGDFAGRLLETAGAKGLRVGGAYVWEEHANVIVSGEGATSSDFLALAQLMAARVRHQFGVELQPEVRGIVL